MTQLHKFAFVASICLFPSTLFSADNPLKSAVDTTLSGQTAGIESQKRIDKIADETRDIVHEYRGLLRSIDSLASYNLQLKKITDDQEAQLTSIDKQLNDIEETRREIVPLMLKMLDVLEEFISLDMPFLQEERQQRLSLLKEIMDSADVTLPDKYRRIIEAYQIEIEYGRTMESYTDTITVNGVENTVDVLRVGRVSLAYVSLDNTRAGFWNSKAKQWQELPNGYLRSIQEGIKMAKKQSPPELFPVPIMKQGGEG